MEPYRYNISKNKICIKTLYGIAGMYLEKRFFFFFFFGGVVVVKDPVGDKDYDNLQK